jgi:hypothetical protein
MKHEKLLKEIKQVLSAIEADLDPYVRGDSMNYTGYLAENTLDLQVLIAHLLKQGK